MTPFVIGKKYICREVPLDWNGPPLFLSGMTEYINKVMTCIDITIGMKDVYAEMNNGYDWNRKWVEDYIPPPEKSVFTCICLSTSCNCGAFEDEMKAKGLVYNKYLKLWETKRS